MRLIDWWRLWRAGYCTKHAIRKTTYLDRMSATERRAAEMDLCLLSMRGGGRINVWPKPDCELCDLEASAKRTMRNRAVVKAAEEVASRVRLGGL